MALSQSILDRIKELTEEGLSSRAIAAELGISRSAAWQWQSRFKEGVEARVKGKKVKELKIKELENDEDVAAAIKEDRAVAALKIKSKNSDKKYTSLLNYAESLEGQLKVALAIKGKVSPVVIPTPRRTTRGNATAIALASDWHVGEVVRPETVNYLNEYNPSVSEKRAKNFFKNYLKLVETQRHSVDIETGLIWLGGDIITGYIHEELVESNSMSPIEETLFAQDLIAGGIKFLLKEGEFKKLIIPCSFGNHGRTTPKKRISTGYANSYEWGMYHNLARYFENDPRVEFHISQSYFIYVNIYGYILRFHHGDNIGYSGGVGGITIPLNKFIARTNQQRVAYLDCIGHFHQLQHTSQAVINGSLIGFGAYAQSLGASPETAQQAFLLVDSKRGKTISAPISVVDESERYPERDVK